MGGAQIVAYMLQSYALYKQWNHLPQLLGSL